MVLVDAHNLLFRINADRRGRGWDLYTLADRLAGACLFRRAVVLVCDGDPPPGLLAAWAARDSPSEADAVSFHFSGPEVEADDVIAALLKSALRPQGILVVTSDRRVATAAKACGSRHQPTQEICKRLVEPPEKRSLRPAFAEAVPLSRAEVELWLAELGVRSDGTPVARSNRIGVPHPERTVKNPGSSMAPHAAPPRAEQTAQDGELDMEHWLKLFPPPDAGARESGPRPKPRRRRRA